MHEYEIFIEEINPCGGEKFSKKTLLEAEADSPEESLAAYRGGGRSNGAFCRFFGHPGELPRLGATDLEA